MSLLSRPASLLGSAAIAGLLVAGLAACSDDPERDESGEVTEGGDESVFDIAVGDCLDSSAETATEVSSLPVVPCEEPHDSEVFHIYEVPGDTFPGDFTQMANEQCMPAFQTFIGMPYEQSAIEVTTLEPTSQTWNEQNDRELVCIAVDPAGNVTGSLQGANR